MGPCPAPTIVRPSRGRTGAELENNRPVTGLAIDTSGDQDIVYVGWSQVYQDRKTAVAATSLDAGKTFSEPVNVAFNYLQDEAVRLELGRAAGRPAAPTLNSLDITWPVLTVDGKGTLYAIWHARGRPGPPVDDSATYLSRSTDRGKTFTVAVLGNVRAGSHNRLRLNRAECPHDPIGHQEEVRSLWIAARRENRHLHPLSATGGAFGALVPAVPAREAREAVLTGRS